MKKLGQIALLARQKRGVSSGGGGGLDGSESEVDSDNRVAYTSATPVDVVLGDFALTFKNGQWVAKDGKSRAATTAVVPAAAAAPTPAAVSASKGRTAAATAAAESAELKRLRQENGALKGEVNMLKFKVELLLDMVTLANLDCDKLEDELDNVKQ